MATGLGMILPQQQQGTTGCRVDAHRDPTPIGGAATATNNAHSVRDHPEFRLLTRRQREVFWLLSYGACNKTIAREMGLREATIKAYVSAILETVNCSNRTQAALIGLAMREGLPMQALVRT